MELLKKHHYDYEKFCYIKDRINIYGNNKELQVACFSCRSYTHITKECGFVSCQKTIYKSCSNEKDQTRLSVILKAVRKDRVKFNARINHNEIEKKGEIFYLDNPGILDFDNAHNNPDSATLYTPGIKSKDSSYVSFYDENSSEKKEDSPRICDMNINKRLQSSQGTLELILMKKESDKYELMLGFESMKSYDLYFPHNNSHSVMKKMK